MSLSPVTKWSAAESMSRARIGRSFGSRNPAVMACASMAASMRSNSARTGVESRDAGWAVLTDPGAYFNVWEADHGFDQR